MWFGGFCNLMTWGFHWKSVWLIFQQTPVEDSETKYIIEVFLLASAHKMPASQTEKAANGECRSSEDYVNVACDLDKYLQEHECSERWLHCQLEHMN